MAQGFLVLVQGTYILWRGIDSNMTHTTNSSRQKMGMLIIVLEKNHFNNITHEYHIYCTDTT